MHPLRPCGVSVGHIECIHSGKLFERLLLCQLTGFYLYYYIGFYYLVFKVEFLRALKAVFLALKGALYSRKSCPLSLSHSQIVSPFSQS